jgi:hypothetical protein
MAICGNVLMGLRRDHWTVVVCLLFSCGRLVQHVLRGHGHDYDRGDGANANATQVLAADVSLYT